MRKIYLVGTVGSWILASACGRLGTGDNELGDGDGDTSIGDGDGDGDVGDGDGDVGDGDGDVGDGDGDVGDGDGDISPGGAPGDGDGDEMGGLGGMMTGDGDGDMVPPDPGLPSCTIISPKDGTATAFHGERLASSSTEPADGVFSGIKFQATASDPEDGELEGESIAWFLEGAGDSGADRLLGFGNELTVDSLPPGENTVSCHAFDSEDNQGIDSVIVKSVSPVIYINHPTATDAPRVADTEVELVAVGYDYEDGVLNPETFTWYAFIEPLDRAPELLGNGNGAYKLEFGTYAVLVSGQDSDENSTSAQVPVKLVVLETQ